MSNYQQYPILDQPRKRDGIARSLTPLMFLMLTACGTSRMTSLEPETGSRDDWMVSHSRPEPSISSAREQLASILRLGVEEWHGVRHVMGGIDESGVDCSGLVQRIFADALNVAIPRTTAQLQKTGSEVLRSMLSSGDLVFFLPDGKGRHVGIFLDEGKFAHASSSRGVMISDLESDFWSGSYTGARRILDSPESIQAAVAYATQASHLRRTVQNRRSTHQ